MHYAVPRILHASGHLDRFFTDFHAGTLLPWCERVIPGLRCVDSLRRLAGRVPHGVPVDRITAFNLFGVRYARRRRQVRSEADLTGIFLWAGRDFCRRVAERGLGRADAVYVFNTAGLEILDAARLGGKRRVLEQTVAPLRILTHLIEAENRLFPGWATCSSLDPNLGELSRREEEKWRLADLILCGSEFVRDGIARCGGPVERCVVVPYGVDHRFRMDPRRDHGGPLRVLTIGGIGLRKGAPHILAAARALRGRAVFRMVGPIEITREAAATLASEVELVGPVPRSAVAAQYAWADVFLLPSLCEGSATAVYEALAASLPVICTPNTGSVVRHQADGLIVPIRDSEAIVDALERLAGSGELRRTMAINAQHRSRSFDLAAYARRLTDAVGIRAVDKQWSTCCF
jgi:glycosyltransferase involved in cell wall biosynthesis